MKKFKKTVLLMLTFVLSASFFVGCKPAGKVINSIDTGRKQIYIQLYNGGYGTEWIEPVIEEFENDYPDYQIMVDPKKMSCADIENYINYGTEYCAFMGYVPDFSTGIYSGLLADLSDMLDMDIDGNGVTIGEKIKDKEQWFAAVSKYGEGCYALPYADSINGFMYDHSAFVERGYLYTAENTAEVKSGLSAQGITYHEEGDKLIFDGATGKTNYSAGDVILRAGKDNKYGTYDDGQPVTESEFQAMVTRISSDENSYAFIYSGKVIDYTTDIFTGVLAQYEGKGNYSLFNNYEGEYTFDGDSEPTVITKETGYKVYRMKGVEKAFDFFNTNLLSTDYSHPQSFISESSHTDAQSYFLLGSAMTSRSNPFAGMLVDGNWWEYESRTISNMLKKRGIEGYDYGTHDFRIMLLPDFEGQNNVSGKTVLVSRDCGSFVVNGKMDEELTRMTKLFCAYTLKDKWLRHFTVTCGANKPYEYELTEEEYNTMSRFARNAYDMYRDNEHIEIVKPWLSLYAQPLAYATPKGTTNLYYSIIDKITTGGIYQTLQFASTSNDASVRNNPAKASMNGMYEYYKANWSQYYSAYVDFMNQN